MIWLFLVFGFVAFVGAKYIESRSIKNAIGDGISQGIVLATLAWIMINLYFNVNTSSYKRSYKTEVTELHSLKDSNSVHGGWHIFYTDTGYKSFIKLPNGNYKRIIISEDAELSEDSSLTDKGFLTKTIRYSSNRYLGLFNINWTTPSKSGTTSIVLTIPKGSIVKDFKVE